MCICARCMKSCDVGFVRGVSDLAGGEYYNGPEICERCISEIRENAIACRQAISVCKASARLGYSGGKMIYT